MESAVTPQNISPELMQQFQAFMSQALAPKVPEEKVKGFSNSDYLQESIKREAFKRYEFVRVKGVGEHGTIYYRPVPTDEHPARSFRQLLPVDADRIVKHIYMDLYNMAPADKIKATVETMKVGVEEEMESIDNNLIQLADDLYWDTRDARLTSDPTEACMRELFDSRGTNEIKVELSDMVPTIIRQMYKKTSAHLQAHNGIIDVDAGDEFFTADQTYLKPFWTWANEEKETFNDLLKAVATNFMEHKPKGAFVLIGLKRNGKSTFLKMLHVLFGRNNTSSVRLSDLNNHGLNGDLWTTMMNAPDEEDEGRGKDLLEAQGNFKSIAAHESLKLRRLYAQSGQWVNSDFMCFFPMNHFPEWKGNGAAACMHRTLPLFFNNDLSKYDNNGKDFATETYTAYFFSYLLGVVLAIANYYSDREIKFSDKMKHDQERVAEEVDNISLYLDRFKSWFNGYKSKKLVYADYQMWCRERDLRWQEYSVFSHTLEMRGPKMTSLTLDDRRISVYKIGDREGNDYFREDLVIKQLKYRSVSELMTTDSAKGRAERSVVAMLDELKDAAENQAVLETASDEEIESDIQELWG
jgi:hypothetical protein